MSKKVNEEYWEKRELEVREEEIRRSNLKRNIEYAINNNDLADMLVEYMLDPKTFVEINSQ